MAGLPYYTSLCAKSISNLSKFNHLICRYKININSAVYPQLSTEEFHTQFSLIRIHIVSDSLVLDLNFLFFFFTDYHWTIHRRKLAASLSISVSPTEHVQIFAGKKIHYLQLRSSAHIFLFSRVTRSRSRLYQFFICSSGNRVVGIFFSNFFPLFDIVSMQSFGTSYVYLDWCLQTIKK